MKTQLGEFIRSAKKVEVLKSVFNTLSVAKLMWVDRINPNILPFYNGNEKDYYSFLERNGYINAQCKSYLMSQTNRNYLSKFNGLLTQLNQYITESIHQNSSPSVVSTQVESVESTPLMIGESENILSIPYSIHEAIEGGKTAQQILEELNQRFNAGKLQLVVKTIQNSRTGEYFDDDGVLKLQDMIGNSIIIGFKYRKLLHYLSDPKKYRGGKKKRVSKKVTSKKKKVTKK